MNHQAIQEDLQRFKTEMLMYRPFFGDILLRLPIVQDDSIPTACADGRTIRWNNRFFSSLTSAQRHYVLMHEVLHTLLMHPTRMEGHDPEIWNVAADMVVNSMCDKMCADVNKLRPEKLMERPPDGIFATITSDCTVESLYGMLKADYEKNGNKASIKKDYRPGMHGRAVTVEITPDRDLLPGGLGGRPLTARERQLLEQQISALIRSAAAGDRSDFGSYFIPRELVKLTQPKPVSWRQMLKEHLTEVTSDDASYATPERKYLHMDLILPGYCLTEDGDLESLWAFVVALGNREDDDGVYIHLAGPLADRFEIHYIESDFESWKYDFALKNGIHPYVIDYLTFKPAALHTQDPDSGEMVFATPRSWERVSDILNIDDDIHKEVIKNKIIGNVGTVEGTQFVEYCKQHHQTVPVQKLLDGSAKMPDSPEELALLADRLTNHVSFLAKSDKTDLPQEQEKQVEDVILALIRLPQAEYALMGLKKLMEMNREAVKKVFSGMDQPEVIRFVERHKFAMGLTAGGLVGDARKNWMALWK